MLTASRPARRGREAASSAWVGRAARAGFAARGLVYILIAYLAAEVAAGGGGREVDRDGAMHAVIQHPFGRVVVIVLAVGFGAYAAWQGVCALFGPQARGGGNDASQRLRSAGVAVFYAFLCSSTALFAAGRRRAASGGNGPEVEWTARVMRHTLGRYAVGLTGCVLIIAGIVMVVRALSGHHDPEVHPPAAVRAWVERLGAVGLSARAIVIASVGVFLLEAAVTFDPNKAKGLDGTLKSFAHTPLGPWLLFAIAAGVLAFGVYALAEAAWGVL